MIIANKYDIMTYWVTTHKVFYA